MAAILAMNATRELDVEAIARSSGGMRLQGPPARKMVKR